MKLKIAIATLLFACAAEAKAPVFYQKGTLVKMDSVECGVEAKSADGVGGVLGVDDSHHTKTRQMLCQEYLLRGAKMDYKIRPVEEKHPALLPIGDDAQFRIQKDRLLVLIPEFDSRERAFNVVAVAQRPDAEKPTVEKAEVKAER
jgi:hypothetical protein